MSFQRKKLSRTDLMLETNGLCTANCEDSLDFYISFSYRTICDTFVLQLQFKNPYDNFFCPHKMQWR